MGHETIQSMTISDAGLALVKEFEGLFLEAYLCPADVWTIGYGHTKTVSPGMEITEKQADALLRADMQWASAAVRQNVDVELTQSQFDALVSFTFNCGSGALQKSTLRKVLNQKNYEGVPAQLMRWQRGGGRVLAGLTRRRRAECALWRNLDNKSSTEPEKMAQSVEPTKGPGLLDQLKQSSTHKWSLSGFLLWIATKVSEFMGWIGEVGPAVSKLKNESGIYSIIQADAPYLATGFVGLTFIAVMHRRYTAGREQKIG